MELNEIKDSSVKISVPFSEDKKVGFLFGFGIFIAPYIFGWFTLKKGYSNTAKAVAFGWMFVVIAINISSSSNVSRTTASQGSPSVITKESEASEDFTVNKIKESHSEYGTLEITGSVKNNTDKQYSYAQVEFTLYDKDGAQIGSTMANINNLEPKGLWKFKAMILEKNVATYKFNKVTAF